MKVLLVGDSLHPDFASVRAYLAGETGVQLAKSLPQAEAPAVWDVIALCQSRPGQFLQGRVEQLHALSPLAHLLAILGSWCEGEMRSGHPWHGVDRVYWYDAIGRLRSLLRRECPATAQRMLAATERIEQSMASWRTAGFSAAVFAERRADYEPLADVCVALGAAPRWDRSWQAGGAAPDLLLAVLEDLQARPSLEVLARLCTAWPAASRIALLNFPRHNEVELLREAGFHHVFGKPLMVADLLSCLGQLTVPQRQK